MKIIKKIMSVIIVLIIAFIVIVEIKNLFNKAVTLTKTHLLDKYDLNSSIVKDRRDLEFELSPNEKLEFLNDQKELAFNLGKKCDVSIDNLQQKTKEFDRLVKEFSGDYYVALLAIQEKKKSNLESILLFLNLDYRNNHEEVSCTLVSDDIQQFISNISSDFDYLIDAHEKYKQEEQEQKKLLTDFSLSDIEVMARNHVKVSFSGEREYRFVTTNMTPNQLVQVEMLDLSNLGLTKLPSWIGKFKKLRSLNLSNNLLPINELEKIKNLELLESLTFNSNDSDNAFIDDGYAIRKEFARKTLGIMNSILRNLPNLTSLSLSYPLDIASLSCGDNNKLSSNIPNVKQLSALKKLSFAGYMLRQIDLSDFPSTLQQLDLSDNCLYGDAIKFSPMPSLEKLSLAGNRKYIGGNHGGTDSKGKVVLSEEFGDAFAMPELRVLDVDEDVIIPKGLERKLSNWTTEK